MKKVEEQQCPDANVFGAGTLNLKHDTSSGEADHGSVVSVFWV